MIIVSEEFAVEMISEFISAVGKHRKFEREKKLRPDLRR